MQIIVFKCKVNICNQDLGHFCQERDPEGKKQVGEEQGATEPPAGWGLGALGEVGKEVGRVGWPSWALGAMMEVGGWEVELQSLLGWLWWHWELSWTLKMLLRRQEGTGLRAPVPIGTANGRRSAGGCIRPGPLLF